MLSLTAKKEDLKRAFGIAALASSDQGDRITGHALVKVTSDKISLYTTDGDRMAFATISPINMEGSAEFTMDPKKMVAVISSTEIDVIRIEYDSETQTVKVYASDRPDGVLSFPTFKAEDFLSFDSDMEKAVLSEDVDTGVLQTGIKFIQGFLPEEKTPKSEKYARLYAVKGTLYGANGSNKIGAFQSPELAPLDEVIIRRAMLNPIAHMIERSGLARVSIATTSGKVFVTAPDWSCGFGFLRTNDAIPHYPITVEDPQNEGFKVDRPALLKKMGRLAITSKELGIKAETQGNVLSLETLSERVSRDSVEVTTLNSDAPTPLKFIFDYKLIKSILNLFQTPDINMYIDKFKCILVSQAEVEIIATKERKPFKAVALMSLARAL